MKKFFRNLFSGYFLVLIILLFELAAIVFFYFFLDETISAIVQDTDASELVRFIASFVYVGLRIFIFAVGLVIFFKIIAKQEDPEFKIPWIVGMLLLPLFVSVIYIIFGNHGLRKKDKKLIEANKQAYDQYCLISSKRQERYKQELERAAGTFNYINSTTGLFATKHNNVTYYKNGETFFPDFIEGLKQAKEFIFMEFFIIHNFHI